MLLTHMSCLYLLSCFGLHGAMLEGFLWCTLPSVVLSEDGCDHTVFSNALGICFFRLERNMQHKKK